MTKADDRIGEDLDQLTRATVLVLAAVAGEVGLLKPPQFLEAIAASVESREWRAKRVATRNTTGTKSVEVKSMG